jgi:O-antigen/teichoic acid export membrane protein
MPESPQTLLRQFLSGSIWAFSGKVVGVVAALAVHALLARLLDPEAFGVYVLAVSLVTVASILASLGMNSAVVRLLGQSHGIDNGRKTRNIIKQCLLIAAAGAVIAGVLLAGPAGEWLARDAFGSELLESCLAWMGIWIFALTAQMLVAESHRGIKSIRYAAFFGGPIAAIGLILFLLASLVLDVQISVRTAIALSAVTALLVLPVGALLLWRNTPPSRGAGYMPTRQVMSLALPMLVTNFTLVILNQADIWIVGVFLEKDQVALYGAALQIASLISFPLLVLNSVIPPYIAESHELGHHSVLQDSLRRATGFAAYASIAGFLICVAVSGWLLELIYGEFYREAAGLLIVIAAGRLANVLAGPCGMVLMMTGFHRLMMWVNILSGVIAVLSMVFVVRSYGVFGVAVVAAFMMIAQNIAMLWLARSRTGIWTHAELDPRALLSS